MVGTSPQEGSEYICLKAKGQYFLGVNNGLLTSALKDAKITGARKIEINGVDLTEERELFAAAAAHLVAGGTLDRLGPLTSEKVKTGTWGDDYAISGNVIMWIAETCITNITKVLFDQLSRGAHYDKLARNRAWKRIYPHCGSSSGN